MDTAGPRPTVLCIEDDDDIWKMMSRKLSSRWSLVRAASDVEACVMLRTFSRDLACVTMDLNLQGSTLNGIDLVRIIRGSLPPAQLPVWARSVVPLPSLPVIVVTGSDVLLHRARDAGATKVMLKPFSLQVLDDELARQCGLPVLGATGAPAARVTRTL